MPPKAEYTATEMTHELHDSLATLVGWAERHRTDIAAARSAYDQRPADPGAGDGSSIRVLDPWCSIRGSTSSCMHRGACPVIQRSAAAGRTCQLVHSGR